MTEAVRVRLLICGSCKSIEELPWYEGPQEHDDTGNFRLSQHKYGDGRQHPFTVGDVAKTDWDNRHARAAIIKGITEQIEGRADAGLGQAFYDVKASFLEDAMTCWKRHNRTTDCDDYMSDKMRLLPETRAERKAEGLDTRHRPNTWLCQFCPVASVGTTQMRKKRGDYDKKSWEG